MDIQVGDILTMKKEHPCGDKRGQVLRTGMDLKLRCLGCGHEVHGVDALNRATRRADTIRAERCTVEGPS